ncbi:MAG: molybdopterin biosynthesis protein [Clostridia bacterium]|nr:molybdopterin biosynthesis protein [Clostridia bacterium]
MQKVYLDNVPLDEARKMFLEKIKLPCFTERIKTQDALGRVLAQPVFAKRSMPAFHASAMDGIAVDSNKTFGASEQNPIILTLDKDFVEVDTGDPIPEGFDAVIMIEDIHWVNENQIEILAPAAPWQHIRPVGEDVVAGEIILPAHHKLTPPDLGVLLAGGILEVEVLVPPRVAIIPTGTELIKPEEEVSWGKIVDFNSTVLAAYITQWTGTPQVYPIIVDDRQLIKEGILKALEDCDILVVNAGSSAGREDYTAGIISELGEVFVHGIATKPGKPVILGKIRNKPVIGIPGYPVSAYLALEWFVRPLIYNYYGLLEPEREKISVTLGRRLVSAMGKEEFVRMAVGFVNGKYVANPLKRGGGVTMTLVKAHGILRIPANSLGYEQGQEVEIELLKPKEEIRNTIVVVGSHDLSLDILSTLIRNVSGKLFISSSHVGSMGGILAIQKGEAHVAGTHLLDPETGEYNISYVEKLLKDKNVVLVNLLYREQGLIIPRGNPKGIKQVEDILTKGLTMVNRQKGAGTRVLFDHLLKTKGIDPTLIKGYNREEFTHLGVAAAVKSGSADVAVGIKSAANIYDLDFLPIGEERYDLLMEKDFLASSKGQILMNIINSSDFHKKVEALGGYSTRSAGQIIWQN